MQINIKKTVLLLALIIFLLPSSGILSQKLGFINSDIIRDKFIEAKQGEQRIQSIVDEWKRELESMQKQIEALEFEINKNRLIWTDNELLEKQTQLEALHRERRVYARIKFEPGGEYDLTVKSIMNPIEDKIYAAVNEIASEDGFDMIFDQAIQAMPYGNFKYDLTLKVLRKLGVDVEQMEKDLDEKIQRDPRNVEKDTRQPRSKRRAVREAPSPDSQPESDDDDGPEFEPPTPDGSPVERPSPTRPPGRRTR